MTKSANILQELGELKSWLATQETVNPYTVPAGYFEGLAEQVLRRIRAEEAGTAAEELAHLSPFLAGASKKMPYTVPAGYFETLEESLLFAVKDDQQTAGDELAEISPLLGGLNKSNPYSLPEGYFENLSSDINRHTTEPVKMAKVVSITHRRWFRMAAAAVFAGLLVTAGFVYNSIQEKKNSFAYFEKKLSKEIQKTPDAELTEMAELLDDGQSLASNTTDPKEAAADLLKDIPASELKDFLDETGDNETINN